MRKVSDAGMNRSDWEACNDPQRMIRYLIGSDYPRIEDVEVFPDCIVSQRKLRLFACACYHRIRHLLPDPHAQGAIDVANASPMERLRRREAAEALTAWLFTLSLFEDSWRASRWHGGP